MYVFIVILFRLMGKREIGELGLIDLAVFIMVAEMAVMSIDDLVKNFFHSIYPMILLTLIQVFFAFISLKSRRFRKLVDGEPTIIIKNGKIMEKEMKKQRYNFDDLLMQLRDKDISNIADVEYALLEPTGKLSVIKKEKNSSSDFTIPLILDGKIQYDKIESLNKSEKWLVEELRKKGYKNISEISFCSYQNGELYVDRKSQ